MKQSILNLMLRLKSKRPYIDLGPVMPIWNEYMNWLTFVNPGMLERGNAYCFNYAISHLPTDAPIVEIGSFCGLSTNMIAYLKEKQGVINPLITCDKWIFEGVEEQVMVGDSESVPHSELRSFVRESFIRNTSFFSRRDRPYTVDALSDEFFAMWAENRKCRDVFGRDITLGGPISFCYVDGDHSYEAAKRDFGNLDRYLVPGGFVLFDDSANGESFGVCQLVKEVLVSGKYELVARAPNYFFKKR